MSLDVSPHYPVMLNEVISSLNQGNKKTIVDCTFGCGGYSNKLLEAFPNCKIIASGTPSQIVNNNDAKNAYFGDSFKIS